MRDGSANDTHSGDPSAVLAELSQRVASPVWHRDALCREAAYRGLPWVPDGGVSAAILDLMRAVCADCRVTDECVAFRPRRRLHSGRVGRNHWTKAASSPGREHGVASWPNGSGPDRRR